MRRHFEDAEDELKSRLLHMGSLAETMVHEAVRGLSERNVAALDRVFDAEHEVNRLHIEIDDRCFKIIALHQPAASDLRFLMASIKINSDLERIADQAVNVSENARILLGLPRLERQLLDIPRMCDLAKSMVKDSITAFVRKDVELARQVVERDNEEDKLKSQAFHELMQLMQSDSSTIQRALGLILIARNLERIADHATNIAEDVIFMVLGKDIRHAAEQEALPPA
ncbi:MAG: phosphate signaling complex protein PhoU [Elusimicrobia bacterium]|nr:phosphate signaling complex protein PhoU [Elusimicrobiota bacterium]